MDIKNFYLNMPMVDLEFVCIVFSLRTKGSSTTLNLLVAGSIIVRAIKSMIVSSLHLRV
jgi:hypothetical protein